MRHTGPLVWDWTDLLRIDNESYDFKLQKRFKSNYLNLAKILKSHIRKKGSSARMNMLSLFVKSAWAGDGGDKFLIKTAQHAFFTAAISLILAAVFTSGGGAAALIGLGLTMIAIIAASVFALVVMAYGVKKCFESSCLERYLRNPSEMMEIPTNIMGRGRVGLAQINSMTSDQRKVLFDIVNNTVSKMKSAKAAFDASDLSEMKGAIEK
jgi:hypothetical protein